MGVFNVSNYVECFLMDFSGRPFAPFEPLQIFNTLLPSDRVRARLIRASPHVRRRIAGPPGLETPPVRRATAGTAVGSCPAPGSTDEGGVGLGRNEGMVLPL